MPTDGGVRALELDPPHVECIAGSGPGFLAIPPERVRAVVADQATTRRPRTRVLVGASAKVFARLHRSVPDRLWDRMVGAQFV